MRKAEPVRVLGQDVFRAHRIEHRLEILHEVKRMLDLVPVGLQAIGRRPVRGEAHVMPQRRAAIAMEFDVRQIVEVLADEFFGRIVLRFGVIERYAMAEVTELFRGPINVAMAP